MEIKYLRIPEIKIELEGENYIEYQDYEITVNNNYVVQFDMTINASYEVINGFGIHDDVIGHSTYNVEVFNAKYGQEDFYDLTEEESEELSNMIAKQIIFLI